MTTPEDADLSLTTADSTAPRQPPTQVVVSFWLLLVSAALWALIAVSNAVSWNSQVNTLLRQPHPANITRDQALRTIHEYLIVNLALFVVFAVLYVLFAFMVRAGRNWARLTITVVVALLVIFGVLNGASLYSLVIVLLGLVAVGLLYLRPAKEFFAALKAANPSPVPAMSPLDVAPVRYAESGSTWWPATWGVVFALVGGGVEALSGPVHVLLWVLVGVGLSGLALIWVQARRRVCSLRLTVDTLYQGREPLSVERIAELDDVGTPIGARVLGGGWTVPKKFTEVPLRLADGTVVVAWAKDPEAFLAALRPLVTA